MGLSRLICLIYGHRLAHFPHDGLYECDRCGASAWGVVEPDRGGGQIIHPPKGRW